MQAMAQRMSQIQARARSLSGTMQQDREMARDMDRLHGDLNTMAEHMENSLQAMQLMHQRVQEQSGPIR